MKFELMERDNSSVRVKNINFRARYNKINTGKSFYNIC